MGAAERAMVDCILAEDGGWRGLSGLLLTLPGASRKLPQAKRSGGTLSRLPPPPTSSTSFSTFSAAFSDSSDSTPRPRKGGGRGRGSGSGSGEGKGGGAGKEERTLPVGGSLQSNDRWRGEEEGEEESQVGALSAWQTLGLAAAAAFRLAPPENPPSPPPLGTLQQPDKQTLHTQQQQGGTRRVRQLAQQLHLRSPQGLGVPPALPRGPGACGSYWTRWRAKHPRGRRGMTL